jgi:replicative DNA helicase
LIEELQLINHWLVTKDPAFMAKNGIDQSYFFALEDVVKWVEDFRNSNRGALPTPDLVAVEFDEFRKLADLDSVDYLVQQVKEQKAYTEYAPALERGAGLLNDGKTLESMIQLRGDIDTLLQKYANKAVTYDWVKSAVSRYDEYMKKHGKEGMAGLPTGIPDLDELTGGWLEDDLILLAGRLNEGKSLIGGFFAFHVWMALKKANINRPVAFISTEMSELEVSYRLDSMKAHFSNMALRNGKLADPQIYLEYLEQLQKESAGFLILSQESNGGSPFKTSDIHGIVASEKPAFLVVDQLYDVMDIKGDWDIRRRIVNVTREIRDMNLLTKTPTMLLAQAGREAAKDARKNSQATPEIDQIQESDNPAQKATRAITLRRLGDTFKLSLKKNRSGKKDEDVYLKADIDTGVYEPTTEDEMVF